MVIFHSKMLVYQRVYHVRMMPLAIVPIGFSATLVTWEDSPSTDDTLADQTAPSSLGLCWSWQLPQVFSPYRQQMAGKPSKIQVIWRNFPENVDSGVPKMDGFIRENPVKMDDLGVPPILGNLHMEFEIILMAVFNMLRPRVPHGWGHNHKELSTSTLLCAPR